MRPFSLFCILLLILVAETEGQMCRFRSGHCHDVGDIRGKCSASGGSCIKIEGRSACRCKPSSNPPINADDIPNNASKKMTVNQNE
ncbi:hypothetical protein ACJMK2_004476 [Sinanodonta woodiana]|uniref:Uncharacterized protein n=1 Tax=Sinanodonta woodiana TaxID=1069815 RepID=A0ABD3Y1E1_SINWO